jgi:uncharacterized membrane protein
VCKDIGTIQYAAHGRCSAAVDFSYKLCRVLDKPTLLLLLLLVVVPAVVFDGSDLVGVDEARPYTARPMDYYTGACIALCVGNVPLPVCMHACILGAALLVAGARTSFR